MKILVLLEDHNYLIDNFKNRIGNQKIKKKWIFDKNFNKKINKIKVIYQANKMQPF